MVAYRNGGMRMWHVESVAVAREYARSENGKQREAAAGRRNVRGESRSRFRCIG